MIRYNVLFHLVPIVAPIGLCGLLWTGQIRAGEVAQTIDRSVSTKSRAGSKTSDQDKQATPGKAQTGEGLAPMYRITRRREGSVTVVRYERIEPADPDAAQQQVAGDKTARAQAVQHSEPRPARWVSVRTTRQVRRPRSWSIHANPRWSYHRPAYNYHAPSRKRFQPRRDWSYHPAGSRTYRPKQDWSYHRQ